MDQKTAVAMVFEAAHLPFTKRELGFPVLKKGEALVQISFSTICTSDLHTYLGRRCSPSPSVLGHEVIGKIVELGEDGLEDFHGQSLRIGDRITWSVYAHDHAGEMASRGLPQKSPGLFKYGHEQISEHRALSGGFASHCHLQAGTDIFRIPDAISDSEAAPLNCTHATIAGAIRLAGDLRKKNVLVTGAGMLGLSACAMAKYAGAERVWTMDLDENRIQRAQDFGADGGFLANTEALALKAEIAQLGGIDLVIDTSGVASAMEKGISLLDIGGTAIWVGAVYSERKTAIDAESIVRRIITIKGLHNYIPEDLAYAIRFMESVRNRHPFASLVGAEYDLSRLGEAFHFANTSKQYRIGIRPSPNPISNEQQTKDPTGRV